MASDKAEIVLPTGKPITFYQPFKAMYIAGRIAVLPVLIPAWAVRYSFSRPRQSWTLRQCVEIQIIRHLMPINAATGLAPLTTDKTREVPQSKLKETSFVWLDPVEESLIKGIAKDDKILPVRIPGYIWPKQTPLTPTDENGLVGLWIHGGGYMMGNGTETFGETEVARKLYKNTNIKNILSIDYRVSSEQPHPAQLLDALAAYNHLVTVCKIDPSRIVVFGACAGGHLVLLLLRYLYEEKVLPMPHAFMLFSPWIDMALDVEIDLANHPARPNTDIDMIKSSYNATLLFLGDRPLNLLQTPAMRANHAPKGSFVSYPRAYIAVGNAEVYQEECTKFADLLREDGVDVTLDVQKDAVHEFFALAPMIPSKGASDAVLKSVQAWLLPKI